MSAASAIVSDIRCAIEQLVDLDHPAATRTAAALMRWLAGQDFDAAAGLLPGWRETVRQKARDVALDAILRLHPGASSNALADLIARGVMRARRLKRGLRPDGIDGYLQDLARAGCVHSARHWRRLVAEAVRVGQRDDQMAKTIGL